MERYLNHTVLSQCLWSASKIFDAMSGPDFPKNRQRPTKLFFHSVAAILELRITREVMIDDSNPTTAMMQSGSSFI